MDGFNTPSKINLQFAEYKVVFSICDCSLDKKYSFYYGLNRESSEKFLKKLKHLEQLTWSQLSALPREDGLTPEKTDAESFQMIHEQNTCPDKLVEQYYFHFRVEKKGLFRVFGYQYKHYFCITHIDYKGRIHHS